MNQKNERRGSKDSAGTQDCNLDNFLVGFHRVCESQVTTSLSAVLNLVLNFFYVLNKMVEIARQETATDRGDCRLCTWDGDEGGICRAETSW